MLPSLASPASSTQDPPREPRQLLLQLRGSLLHLADADEFHGSTLLGGLSPSVTGQLSELRRRQESRRQLPGEGGAYGRHGVLHGLRNQGGGLMLGILTVGSSSSLSLSRRDDGSTGDPGQLWVPT